MVICAKENETHTHTHWRINEFDTVFDSTFVLKMCVCVCSNSKDGKYYQSHFPFGRKQQFGRKESGKNVSEKNSRFMDVF